LTSWTHRPTLEKCFFPFSFVSCSSFISRLKFFCISKSPLLDLDFLLPIYYFVPRSNFFPPSFSFPLGRPSRALFLFRPFFPRFTRCFASQASPVFKFRSPVARGPLYSFLPPFSPFFSFDRRPSSHLLCPLRGRIFVDLYLIHPPFGVVSKIPPTKEA